MACSCCVPDHTKSGIAALVPCSAWCRQTLAALALAYLLCYKGASASCIAIDMCGAGYACCKAWHTARTCAASMVLHLL